MVHSCQNFDKQKLNFHTQVADNCMCARKPHVFSQPHEPNPSQQPVALPFKSNAFFAALRK